MIRYKLYKILNHDFGMRRLGNHGLGDAGQASNDRWDRALRANQRAKHLFNLTVDKSRRSDFDYRVIIGKPGRFNIYCDKFRTWSASLNWEKPSYLNIWMLLVMARMAQCGEIRVSISSAAR